MKYLSLFFPALAGLLLYYMRPSFEGNIVFGTTIPGDKISNPELLSIEKKVKRYFLVYFIFSAGLAVAGWIRPMSMATWVVWMLVVAFLPQLGIAYGYKKTRKLKKEKKWRVPGGKTVLVDTELLTKKDERLLPPAIFYIALVLAFGATALADFHRDLAFNRTPIYLVSALFLLILFFLYRFISNRKEKVVTKNKELNRAISYERKTKLKNALTVLAVFAVPLHYFLTTKAAADPYDLRPMIFLGIYHLGGILLISLYYTRGDSKTERLLENEEKVYRDEDEYYDLFGMKDPDDPRIIVDNRFAAGTAINRGHIKGKIAFYGSILITILVLALCFYLLTADYSATLAEDELRLSMRPYTDRVDLDEITAIVYGEEPLGRAVRINGGATDVMNYGNWNIEGIGSARLYLYRENPFYIRLETADRVIFFNLKTERKTKDLYQNLYQKLHEKKTGCNARLFPSPVMTSGVSILKGISL